MKKKVAILLMLSPLFLCLQCKKCKEGENRQNVEVAGNVKSTLFQFAEGSRWVFKSNTGDMDTVFLGALSYTDGNGDCVDHRDCCTKRYYQQISQPLNYTNDIDGLIKFNKFYFPEHVILSSGGGSFEFSSSQTFNLNYKENLIVNGTSLSDVQSRVSGPSVGPLVDKVYWSLSMGLVRYDYLQSDNTYIIYERQDF